MGGLPCRPPITLKVPADLPPCTRPRTKGRLKKVPPRATGKSQISHLIPRKLYLSPGAAHLCLGYAPRRRPVRPRSPRSRRPASRKMRSCGTGRRSAVVARQAGIQAAQHAHDDAVGHDDSGARRPLGQPGGDAAGKHLVALAVRRSGNTIRIRRTRRPCGPRSRRAAAHPRCRARFPAIVRRGVAARERPRHPAMISAVCRARPIGLATISAAGWLPAARAARRPSASAWARPRGVSGESLQPW